MGLVDSEYYHANRRESMIVIKVSRNKKQFIIDETSTCNICNF